MELPDSVARAVEPLFALLPPQQAMDKLVVRQGASQELVQAVEQALADPALAPPPLQSALWLYIDELDRSHTISQGIEDQTGSYWHGIMHRREGDFSNSHYWFNKVGQHPAMELIADYDAHAFIDRAEAEADSPSEATLQLQRAEWQTLFQWCAAQQ